MSADQCKAMHDKMHGGASGAGMGGMGAMAHDHGAGGGHQHGSESSAIGQPGLAKNISRTVRVSMTDDMKFNPSNINVKQGETIHFVVKNLGKTKHEMVLGTDQDLKEHYQQMMKHPEMEHAEPNMITLAPGKSGEIIWQFTKSGKVQFACLQPGHYDAGMKGVVSVGGTKTATPAKQGDSHDSHQH
ncbi:cupredoxin family protein [Polynucleobacter yangtzensis]|uniref:cupredoxin domain-containing protein n=1 Tax=Polynucleobacter yangtzensis TaxID=1743159 RepID=UPI0009EEE00E